MGRNATKLVLIAGLALLAIGVRYEDRVDENLSGCYADGIGPSTPTICG